MIGGAVDDHYSRVVCARLQDAEQHRHVGGENPGSDPGTFTVTLDNGETIDLSYAEPYEYDGATNTMATAQIATVVVRTNYSGQGDDAIVSNTCGVTAAGLNIVNAILAGEV